MKKCKIILDEYEQEILDSYSEMTSAKNESVLIRKLTQAAKIHVKQSNYVFPNSKARKDLLGK